MQLELVIAQVRARCLSFSGRVAGAAHFKVLPEQSKLDVPCAFVIPLDDHPQENRSQNSIRQALVDSFAVVVALSNVVDERGQASAHTTDSLRAELWAALLGWQPTDRYDGITYEGGQLLVLDRARLWYQFEFGALMEIGPTDSFQTVALAEAPHFDSMEVNVDAISPMADPNLKFPGPDGRIEQAFSVPKSGAMP